MPTAVLDIDFEQLPPAITGLDRYSHALILIRLSNQPVGQVRLPVTDGHISGIELREILTDAVDWPFWERRLHTILGWEKANTTNFVSPLATVAVCTRDRPENLRRCLEALMHLPDDGQELLVVDNCPSTNATQQIVNEYERVRYVREDNPGLNNARNRALLEAQHEIVAFADDDATPDPGWLRALLRNYDHPLTLCVTGLTMPQELETQAQEWFERHISFAKGFQHKVFEKAYGLPTDVGSCGVGANMSLRRNVLELIGPFDEALDAGTPTRSGGDHEMFSRILASGFRIVYDPAALSWHCHRPTWQGVRQQLYGYGAGNFATWTRNLWVEGELSALRLVRKAIQRRLGQLFQSLLRRPDSFPIHLILAILHGYTIGPRAYFVSRKRFSTRIDSYDPR